MFWRWCVCGRCKWIFLFLLSFGMSHSKRNTSVTWVIDCFDCENWHRTTDQLESLHIAHYTSLSLDANESQPNRRLFLSLQFVLWKHFGLNEHYGVQELVESKSKWKLMDFVVETQIQNHRTHAASASKENEMHSRIDKIPFHFNWLGVKCSLKLYTVLRSRSNESW